MTSFELKPLNAREAEYYEPGSMELVRQYRAATPQVWVVTPRDMKDLLMTLAKEVCDGDTAGI